MAVGQLKKQPFEELNCAIDFSNSLAADDTITLDEFLATNSKTGAVSTSEVIAATPAPAVDDQTVASSAFTSATAQEGPMEAWAW